MGRARLRIHTAFRPKTARTHSSHLTLLLQFLQFINTDITAMSHLTTLAFIEFLQFNCLSSSNIQAHISSLRSQFKSFGLSPLPLSHHLVTLALKSLAINVPATRRVKGIFDLEVLHNLVALCDGFPLGFVYKSVFLLAFFAFFRLSNLVPPSVSSFSPLVHLCRGDFIPHSSFATIVVKWSKTLQNQSQFATVQVPCLGSSPLCPLAAVAAMASTLPLPANPPCFLSLRALVTFPSQKARSGKPCPPSFPPLI